MIIPADDSTTLSLLFHLNSEPWLNDEAYRSAPSQQEFKQVDALARTALPPPPESAVARLTRIRRSCRRYEPRPLPLAALSSLASAAYGLVGLEELPDGTSFLRRSVPSAGGLFPLEIYLAVQRIEGRADGLYHYEVGTHSLELLREGQLVPELEPALYTYPFIRDANVLLFLAASFLRSQKKYGPRGYRYILLEAGHSAQNVCLEAAELGLSSLCMGGFVDSRLNRLLGLNPKEEGVVYGVAAGYGAAG